MRIIAFDPGMKNTGVALLIGDSIQTFTINEKTYLGLWDEVGMTLQELIKSNLKPDHAIVEGIIHNSRNPESHLQAHAIICTLLQGLKIPYTEYTPNVWKKLTVGKGNATKQEVMAWVIKHHGKTNQHEADALCMALAYKGEVKNGNDKNQ